MSTLAGVDGISGAGNGLGTFARFSFPVGIAVDSNDIVYVVDYNNHMIRTIDR